tara:strand:- start:226 stop:429 length:204 start_codon:yes stop_codon:yes gene_type:complete
MKKSTVLSKFEKKIDDALTCLYDARDVLSNVEDPELDELANDFVEELEVRIAEDVEKLREAVDNILE